MGRDEGLNRTSAFPVQTTSAIRGLKRLPPDVRPAPRGEEQCVIWLNSLRLWYVDGILHRDTGPAVEYPNGARKWYRKGRRHRIDGPAVESPDGHFGWYRNGRLHREDGPAIVTPDGNDKWFRYG